MTDTRLCPSLTLLALAAYDVDRALPAAPPAHALIVRGPYAFEDTDARLAVDVQVESEGDVDMIADQLRLPPDNGSSANYDRRGGAWLNGRRYLVGVFTGRTS